MMEERVSRLEERLAWLERHVVEQDKVMLEMSEEIERLRRELMRYVEGQSGLGDVAPGSPADERPPHY